MRPTLVLLTLTLSACNPDAGLTKFNAEPEAQITAPSDGSAVLEGTTVTLRGAASDPNHATGELLARWFVGSDEACASVAPAADGTTTCDVVVPEGDTMSVRLEVLDPEGAAATAEATYTVTPNAAPTASIASPVADGVYYSDQLVILRATVDDAEDASDGLSVRWESNLDGQLGEVTPNSEGVVESFVNLSQGAHAVQVFVTDSAGNEGQDTVLIDVGPPNTAPDCVIDAPTDGAAVEQGSTITFRGTVADPDIAENLLTVRWSSDKDGDLGTSTPTSAGTVTFPFADLSADTHVVTMTVTDEVGASCAADVLVGVGTAPVLDIEAPSVGDVVNEGENVAFLALVSDAEARASELTVRWESDLDGLLLEDAPDSSGTSSFYASDLSLGDHVVTVTVTDPTGLFAESSVPFTVNGLPTAPVVSLSPSSPYGSDDLLVSIDAPSVDPEGDRLTYTYAWYQNGVLSSASTSATLPASATNRGDRWTVEVWASDGYGESPVASAGVTIGDSLPTIASVSLSPSTARTVDTLTCVASGASDGDGDTVTLGYAWSVDGSTLSETGSTLAGSWFDKGDVVVCSVTPSSGSGVGTTLSSAPLTIDNTVPTLTSASISPASPRTGDTLTCVTTGWSDADGDADGTTYAWTVNGRAAGTGSSLAGGFVGGDVVACVATPFDGEDTGSPVTASVTVGNTPPVLASVSLTPMTPREGDTLSCAPGSTTDADGTTSFTYAYGWRVNGASIAATTSTLSSTFFDDGDTVACVVTPNDGTANGSAVTSNTVTVANTAPALASVSVSPSSPTETDTLSCVTGSTSDADGDVVTLAYTWSVDGIVIAGVAGSTLTGASFDRGEDVSCTATPFDGAAYGTTLTAAAVTVRNTAPSIISASIAPTSPTASSTLTCSYAGYADPDADPENVTYAWTVNGVAAGSASTLAGTFRGGDVVACVVTPNDGTVSGASRSVSVTVANTAPVLASASLSPGTPREGDTLTCTPGSTTDADGTTSFTYAYGWRVNGVAIAATTSTLSSASFDADDVIACVVTPNDGTANGSAVTSNAVTVANTAPVLTSVSVSPSSPTETDTLSCVTGSTSDADGDVVTLAYTWSVDGVVVAGATTSTLTGASFDRGEDVSCTATPFDGAAYGTTLTATAVTVRNTAPSLTSASISPASPTASSALTCSYAGYADPDADPENVTYAWTVNGTAAGSSRTLSGSFRGGDVVACVVTPNDGTVSGTSRSASVTVTNTAPVLASATLSPGTPREGDTLSCMPGATTDADGTTSFTYTYGWRVNGLAISATTSTLSSASFDDGDTVACVVTPNDGTANGSPVTSNTVTVANTAPALASVSLSPSSPTETDTLSCVTGSTSDADGDVVTLAYTWSVDGVVVTGATGSTLTGASFDRGEDVSCTVTPFDGAAYGSTLTATAVTVRNTAPSLTSASISPASPTASSTLTCSYAGYADPDADPENVTYAWTVNGVAAGSSSTLAGTFRGGDVVACVVTPNDGTVSGASRSASVTVANTSPVLASVSLSPSTPREGDTLSCAPGSTTDADGTASFTYTYAWRVNGSSIAATTSTLSSTLFDDGDTVACVVTPTDGTASGSAVTSNTVTVANTAPMLASVTITPDPPTRSSTLTCTPSGASDADGDVVSYIYRWTVNGVVSGTGATLTGPFAVGALIACTVTPTDGKDSGAAVTDTATVTNTAPVVTSVTLSPSTVRTNDTITANVVSSDADGDTVSLTYTWYVNGSVVSGATSNSLSGVTSFSKNDVVYVSVTPSDASGAGTAVASSSVTVANTAPTAPGVAISPSAPVSGDALTCSVTSAATDSDGDALTYTFAWDVDGVDYAGATTTSTSSTVPGSVVDGGETWTCSAVARDAVVSGPVVEDNVYVEALPCADGTVDVGSDDWRRDDIAYCDFNATPTPSSISVSTAEAYCGVGWHVCSGSEFTARNDLIAPGVRFMAKVNDGERCWAVDTGSGHEINSDAVRETLRGSCTGTGSAARWGRQVTPDDCFGFGGRCGVLCCQ